MSELSCRFLFSHIRVLVCAGVSVNVESVERVGDESGRELLSKRRPVVMAMSDL